jgi:hypothetical protein
MRSTPPSCATIYFIAWLSESIGVNSRYQPTEVLVKFLIGLSLLVISVFFLASVLPEAPTGFDNKINGLVDDATHTADQAKFEETEALSNGFGPLCVLTR